MNKVLITGLSGFTGRHLHTELTKAGYEVVGLTGSAMSGLKYNRKADIVDSNAVKQSLIFHKPDYIIHLAGISFSAHDKPEEYYAVNVIGTENLLRSAYETLPSVKKIIIASSGAVYGNVKQEILTEEICPRPVNHYTFSKLSMEFMAHCWFEKLPITIVRPFNYVGKGQSENFLVPKIVSHFINQAKTIELGNLDVSRDFSDVRDVCQYYRQLLDAPTIGKTLNFCSGELISLRQILEITSRLSGHDLNVLVNPAFMRANEIRRLKGSTNNLYKAIGVQNRRSISDTISWMLFDRSIDGS